MIKAFLIVSLLLFTSCSMEPAPNSWEYKSSAYFESYKKNFLYDKEILAESDLQSARSFAKRGGDVTQLASIELGKCALNIAVGIEDKCAEYQEMEELVTCPRIKNYNKMLQKEWDDIDLSMVPSKYKDFVEAMKKGDLSGADTTVQKIDDPVSKLLALALLGDEVSKETLNGSIEIMSFYGYKKGIVSLLKKLRDKIEDPQAKRLLIKKLELLD
ncbi:hypothetical protein [Sulfurimonas marina]|uniref:Lipoprotein n=1 Tax=Sulfurimonas marina TaxID=2590551 RepID=A0A7M3V943_9BACT|nr:hypothetical protein [Sulfurimonas marina]QOP40276.1 hypothetical protein FJR03_00380 [Sulfurimonas marina]